MERAICSEGCPGLFSQLKEVYLFGCDTLKPEPVRSATPEIVRSLMRSGQSRAEAQQLARELSEHHGESSRDLMRRLFSNVPVIYGFSSLAPYGRFAGPMLERYFETESGEEIGSARVSSKLLSLFGPSSMVVASGMLDSDPHAGYRREVCQYFDDRLPAARKLGFMHRTLGGEMAELRMSFDRVEKFFANLSDGERQDAAFLRALAEVARDLATRERYLAITRDTEDPAIRVRMVALARTVGWLSAAQQQAELGQMIGDVLAASSMSFGEVDLICTLNKNRDLDPALQRVKASPARAPHAAALACLGSAEGHARVLRALASPVEQDVQVAQAYLRHRPITDAKELRSVALGIARMKGSGAQVRALDTLARLHISDREILDELARLFTRTSSLGVQRAIAEIFLRSPDRALDNRTLAGLLRQYRLPSPNGEDLIDALIRRLPAS
jgi:hypothetical protein